MSVRTVSMEEYGTPDSDKTAYMVLLAYVEGMDVKYILHHQRMPIDARPCQLPQSLKVQAVLGNGKVVTCQQAAPSHAARIQ